MDDLPVTEVTKRFSKLFGYVGAVFKNCEDCGQHVWHVPRGDVTLQLDQHGQLHQILGPTVPRAAAEKLFLEAYKLLGAARKPCESCGQEIYMLTTKSGGRMPMTAQGISHFADCPRASYHRRPR